MVSNNIYVIIYTEYIPYVFGVIGYDQYELDLWAVH